MNSETLVSWLTRLGRVSRQMPVSTRGVGSVSTGTVPKLPEEHGGRAAPPDQPGSPPLRPAARTGLSASLMPGDPTAHCPDKSCICSQTCTPSNSAVQEQGLSPWSVPGPHCPVWSPHVAIGALEMWLV